MNRKPDPIKKLYWFYYENTDKYDHTDEETAYNMLRLSQRKNSWRSQAFKYIGVSSGKYLRDVRDNYKPVRVSFVDINEGRIPQENITYQEKWQEALDQELAEARENKKAPPQRNVVHGGGQLPPGMPIGRHDPVRL